MALFCCLKTATRRNTRRHATSTNSTPNPAGAASSSALSQPSQASQSVPTPIPQASAEPTSTTIPASSKHLQSSGIQERLWATSFEELEKTKPELVKAFRRVIYTKVNQPNLTPNGPLKHGEEDSRDPTPEELERWIKDGLLRNERAASVQKGIGVVVQVVGPAKHIMNLVVQAVPQATIPWAGICLGLEILSNPSNESSTNSDGIVYVSSRLQWYWELGSLLLDESKSEQASEKLRSELEKNIIQVYVALLTYQLRSICRYYRHWVRAILRDVVKYDGWAEQLESIKTAERAVQKDIDQYNGVEVRSKLRQLADEAMTVRTGLQNIHSTLQDQAQRQEQRAKDDKDEKCLEAIFATNPRSDKMRIEETKGTLLNDCYSWVLQNDEFQRFQAEQQNQLLWIKGDPGKGKTMLLCGIINELETQPTSLRSALLSYFFCQATVETLNNANFVLRGLIWDLCRQNHSLIKYVRHEYDGTSQALFSQDNAWVTLRRIMTAMLDDPVLQGATMIIDALDECNVDREQLLDFIVSTSTVKWIVSSRNWPDIEQKFKTTKHMNKLHLEMNQGVVDKAVNSYITFKVNQLAKSKDYQEETRNAVESHLTAHARGTFLWVALVCQELARVGRVLAKKIVKEFPTDLNGLYGRMIKQMKDSPYAKVCLKILTLVSAVYRPITLVELHVLLSPVKDFEDIGLDDWREIIASCGSFLTVREDIVYFVHQSAKDFLMDKSTSSISRSSIANQHSEVFGKSMDVLCGTLKRDIYGLKKPGALVDQVSKDALGPLAAIQYSCVFWVDHLEASQVNTHVEASPDKAPVDINALLRFFKTKYLYWLEALSWMHKILEGVKAMEKLERIAMNTDSKELQGLVKDASRFILSQKRGIEIAPLQAYTSALLFSPTNSLIRRLFKQEYPTWIELQPKIETVWNACLQTLEGHTSRVTSVALSSDGKRVASGSDDNTVKIWDATSGGCLQTLEGHTDGVTSVALSSDGKRVASGSYDNTVKIWGATSGGCLQTLFVACLIKNLFFDRESCVRLTTNRGQLDLETSSTSFIPLTQSHSSSSYSCVRCGIDVGSEWIRQDDTNLIWLPPEYRPGESTIVGRTIVIGHGSGRVSIMRLAPKIGMT